MSAAATPQISVPQQPESQSTASRLAAQRLLRAACAAGNRMLTGSRILLLDEAAAAATGDPLWQQLRTYLTNYNTQQPPTSTAADFIFTTTAAPRAGSLVTAPAATLPPLYLPLPQQRHSDYTLFAAAYQAAAAALATHLATLGFIPVPTERADILEFRVAAHTKIPDAQQRSGQRLAVLAQLTQNPTAGDAAGRLAWAARGMPATAALARNIPKLQQQKILLSLILEPKTAALAVLLQRAGATVAVFAPTAECDRTVAAQLSRQGIRVFAPGGADDAQIAAVKRGQRLADPHLDAANAAAALAWHPSLLIDDGSHLIRLAHTSYPATLAGLRGAAEETTSGVRPLLEMQQQNQLRLPVIAVNDARTKTLFDNRIGTGESCVHAILDVLDSDPTDSTWVIWGYGPVGAAVAQTARIYSRDVRIIEHDRVRALQAHYDGLRVITEAQLPRHRFLAVSATGVWHTIKAATIIQHWDTMTLAVAGGIDNEIAIDDLTAAGWQFKPTAHPQLQQLHSPTGKALQTMLLAGGGGVNYTAAEGNPLEVMDLSFATQLAALTALLHAEPDSQLRQPGVKTLPLSAETAVAEAVLRARHLPTPQTAAPRRFGGAAQPWQIHRYRAAGGSQNQAA